MCSILLNRYRVHGDGRNAYDSTFWDLSVYYELCEIWTEDAHGAIDVIGTAPFLEDARRFVADYFNKPYYEKLA